MRRTVILLAMIVVSAPAGAQITSSKHDLTTLADAVTKKYDGQICVYCHTPHNATTTSVALWNKSLAGLPTFDMYYGNTAGSGPLGNARDGTPGQASLACLSCHEGTIAIDAIVNEPVTPTGTGGGIMNNINSGAAALGSSLTNDHPIAVELPTGTEWQTTPTNSVPLFGSNRVECASCHNPHQPGADLKFLRVANTNSNLCKSCHIK